MKETRYTCCHRDFGAQTQSNIFVDRLFYKVKTVVFRETEKMEDDQVEISPVQQYQQMLEEYLIISSPFQDILDRKLNAKARHKQLVVLLVYIGYLIPHQLILLIFTLDHDEGRKSEYRIYTADILSLYGLLGQMVNACWLCSVLWATVGIILIRRFESQGKCYFLTDMLSLERSQSLVHQAILKKIGKYTKISVCFMLLVKYSNTVFILLSSGLFIYITYTAAESRTSSEFFGVILLAILNTVVLIFGANTCAQVTSALVTFKMVTIEFFSSRMNDILDMIKRRDNMKEVIPSLQVLILDFKRQDSQLLHLIRSLIYCYKTILVAFIVILTVDMENAWMKTIILIPLATFCIIIILMVILMARLNSMRMSIYAELNSYLFRTGINVKSRLVLKTFIKEFGSNHGHVVIGLRDGYGSVISSHEILLTNLEVLGNSLMVINMIK